MDYGHEWTEEELKKLEQRISEEYKQASEEVQKKLDAYLEQFEAQDEKKRAEVEAGTLTEKEYKRWRQGKIMTGRRWEAMRDTLVADFHNANLITASMTQVFAYEAYAMNYNFGTFEVETVSGINISRSFTLYDRHTVERLVRDDPDFLPPPGKRLKQLAAAQGKDLKDIMWNRQQVQSVMTQSILQGESIPHMAQRLADEVGETNMNAAIRNARTMTTGAENAGRVDSYKRAESMGIKLKQLWVATLDGRTRHEHRLLDGQKVAVGEPFVVDDQEIRFPGDPHAAPYLVYNCRCTLVAAVEGSGVMNQYNQIIENFSLNGENYEQWKNSKKIESKRKKTKSKKKAGDGNGKHRDTSS